jgi:dolichol-phosphate mannosyltransferase
MNNITTPPPPISVVVPVYGCVDCLEQLCQQLEANLHSLTDRFEIILVDDRSPDNAWFQFPSLQAGHPSVKGIRLSRNYGQHIAITAGLAAARGDYAVVMDCDLQDPPSLIPELFAKLQEGYDLVLAKRVERNHSPFRLLAAKAYFNLLSKLTGESVDGSYGTFSILSRKVIDSFLLFEEKERHYLFILRWLGFRMGSVDFVHQERQSGASSYTLGRLWRHAIDGILFQASVLLRWIVSMGFLFALSGMVMAGYLIWRSIIHTALPGWTSLAVLILVSTGVILISLGIVGLYIGKIFDQSKQRPLYLVVLPPSTLLQLMYLDERINGIPPGRFIEIGPGSGEITNRLLKAKWSGTIYELSAETVSRIKQRFATEIAAGRLTVILGDYLNSMPPSTEDRVNLIISCMVMEHLDDSQIHGDLCNVLEGWWAHDRISSCVTASLGNRRSNCWPFPAIYQGLFENLDEFYRVEGCSNCRISLPSVQPVAALD